MTEFDPGSREHAISRRIVSRVEQKIEEGENHFAAIGGLAKLALRLVKNGHDVTEDAYERIVRIIAENGEEGEIYALRQGVGKNAKDTADYVYISSRDDVPTEVPRNREDGAQVIIRATTAEIDY